MDPRLVEPTEGSIIREATSRVTRRAHHRMRGSDRSEESGRRAMPTPVVPHLEKIRIERHALIDHFRFHRGTYISGEEHSCLGDLDAQDQRTIIA